MKFAFFIAKRIFSTEKRSFSRLIILISRVAIALSMTVMIVAGSMVNGFRETISDKIFGFWGHVNVSKQSLRNSYDDLPMPIDSAFLQWADQHPDIQQVQTYARKAGIIKANGQIEGMILKGVSGNFNVQSFSDYIQQGVAPNLNLAETSGDMLLSETMANRLNLEVGDSAILHFIDQSEDGNFSQRFRKLRVSGLYHTGLDEFDRLFVLADIRHIQRLNNWGGNEIGGYEVFAKDPEQIEAVRDEVLYEANPFWSVQSIFELMPGIFDWLNLQRINERIILILMFVVALINMITSLLILILERTNMIGVLKSLGATNQSIQRVFLWQASYTIVGGMIIGNILGLTICFLQSQYGLLRLPEESYYVSVAPVSVHFEQIIGINLATLLLSLLFLLIPARLVATIHPVKAIRFA